MKKKRILVTGANGFIGKNLVLRLRELNEYKIQQFARDTPVITLPDLVANTDIVIHLAGEPRPKKFGDLEKVDIDLTSKLCAAIEKVDKNIPLIFASSIQVEGNSAYGLSKLKAENIIKSYADRTANSVSIFRFGRVFGKFCKPNHNSVVATFCYNVANNLPIKVDDEKFPLELFYIDDVIDSLIGAFDEQYSGLSYRTVSTSYEITLGELATKIKAFHGSRLNLMLESVANGLDRALYSTYISFLPMSTFIYDLPQYSDARGTFVEFLKTPDHGQVSFFTIKPGVTRGSHYHHTKTEKFLVVKGTTEVRYRNLVNNERFRATLSSDQMQIIDTIPGWVHEITNIGSDEAIVIVWANEVFDADNPDTFSSET